MLHIAKPSNTLCISIYTYLRILSNFRKRSSFVTTQFSYVVIWQLVFPCTNRSGLQEVCAFFLLVGKRFSSYFRPGGPVASTWIPGHEWAKFCSSPKATWAKRVKLRSRPELAKWPGSDDPFAYSFWDGDYPSGGCWASIQAGESRKSNWWWLGVSLFQDTFTSKYFEKWPWRRYHYQINPNACAISIKATTLVRSGRPSAQMTTVW